MLSGKQFWKEVWRLAFKKGVAVTVAVGAVLAILLPFASWFDPYRSGHEKFWAIFDKYAFGWISIAIFWFFVVKHFFQSAYLVYRAETGPREARIQVLEGEITEINEKRPEFQFIWAGTDLRTWSGWHVVVGNNIAHLSGQLSFQNIGEAVAINSTFTTYFCWLQNPSHIVSQGGHQAVGRTPHNGFLTQRFSTFEPARWLATANPPQWWFNDEGLIVRVEISTHANTANGPVYPHSESFFWSPFEPDRFTFPTVESLQEADLHIEGFKSRRATTPPLQDRDTGEPLT